TGIAAPAPDDREAHNVAARHVADGRPWSAASGRTCAIHSALASHGGLRVAKRPAGRADLPGPARSGPGRAGGRPVTCPTRRRPETSRALLRLQLLPQPLLLLPE